MCGRGYFLSGLFFGVNLVLGCVKQISPLEAMPELRTICGVKYGKYDEEWRYVSNSQKGDLAILERLIVKPNPGVDMSQFDYQSLGLPSLEIIGQMFGGYYILDLSVVKDPFQVAQTLCNSEKFSIVQFDAAGEWATMVS